MTRHREWKPVRRFVPTGFMFHPVRSAEAGMDERNALWIDDFLEAAEIEL